MANARNKRATKLSGEMSGFILGNSSEKFSRGIRLQSAWEKIATPQELEHTDNVVFSIKSKDPCILVYVDSSHWAAELGFQKELYKILLERETGWKLSDLKFLVTRKTSLKKLFQKRREKKEAKKDKPIAIPLTEDEDRHARYLVSSIKDEQLRNQLYKAIKADFEWKKGSSELKLSQKPPESPEST
jgi:hypothetical protein